MAAKGVKRRGNTEFIVDDAARKATFKKRKKGLLKKLSEITTLCDVRACAVIYNPATEGQPDIFPANEPSVVANMITEFNGLPEEEQTRRSFNQEDFLAERINKAAEQLRKLSSDNQEMKFSNILDEHMADKTKSFDNLSNWDLYDLARVNAYNFRQLDHQIKNIFMGTDSLAAANAAMANAPDNMTFFNPSFQFHQNMIGGGEFMGIPGFITPDNILPPMTANEPMTSNDPMTANENGFQGNWFAELMRSSQNGGAGISNLINLGSSSNSPSM